MSSKTRRHGLASRLYHGEAGLNIIPRRNTWFLVAGILVLVAVGSFVLSGFKLGIEFRGGNEFQIPASAGTLLHVEETVEAAGAEVVSTQQLGGGEGTYLVRTGALDAGEAARIKTEVAQQLGISGDLISDSLVSAAWGGQVTQQALLGLGIFLILVTVYLVLRFEWRMALAAVISLLFNLVLTAGVYSLVGFEVTPSTIIGFLTILGFALYDVVVVFDKVQENTRGITGGSSRTYAEAANLAVNQTLMRSINTSVVALLPVGGLLFIGAGLLGAGTLKDLGLVLFVGMASAFFSSILVAAPLLTWLKDRDPKFQAHNQRVRARRQAAANRATVSQRAERAADADADADEAKTAALAGPGGAPKVGARPGGGKRTASGSRGGRPGGSRGGRSGGAKRR